jgi:nicotine blue oxidoreductase
VIAGIVLAAGASRRFGAVKQLVELDGVSLLGRAIGAMDEVEDLGEIVVVLGANAQAIMQTTPLRRARVVVCRDWELGLATSLAAGLGSVPAAEAAVITLADQPLVGAAAIRRMIAARRPGAEALAASYGERPGFPLLLERGSFRTSSRLRGDAAEAVIAALRPRSVPCDDVASPEDVDTPANLLALRVAVEPADGDLL